jgi:hypothetical protein
MVDFLLYLVFLDLFTITDVELLSSFLELILSLDILLMEIEASRLVLLLDIRDIFSLSAALS